MAGGGIASEIRAGRSAKKRAQIATIRDRRRFDSAPPANGIISRLAPVDATGTTHPETLRTWRPDIGETILKDGAHNAKIGGDVLSGRLRGAKIFTLSLEERATCPRSCALWRGCYGNNLHQTRRWNAGTELETGLAAEVQALCRMHRKVLIRLHVVGDFYSMRYLALWVLLLDDHPNLHIFGFTAWKIDSEIGAGIARVRAALGRRFAIRHSNTTGEWGSFTIDAPTQKARLGEAIVCPEQRSANGDIRPGVHCGNCTACWRGNAPIVFIEHG